MVRSVKRAERPEFGCSRSGIDLEIDVYRGTNCVFKSWFNELIWNKAMCIEFEDNHFCNAAIEEWGTADCYDKFKAWSDRGKNIEDWEFLCPVMDPRCVRVRDLVCTRDYALASGYDSNPDDMDRFAPYSNLKTMCDAMASVQGLSTAKCSCQDWPVTTIANLEVPRVPDGNDCTIAINENNEKVFQVGGTGACQLHCAAGHIPNPSRTAFLECPTGFANAETTLSSCDIGVCAEPPRETDMATIDEAFSETCMGQNHGTYCNVQCQGGLSISGSGRFRCLCEVTEGFAGDFSINCRCTFV